MNAPGCTCEVIAGDPVGFETDPSARPMYSRVANPACPVHGAALEEMKDDADLTRLAGGALTVTQQLYTLLREAADQAAANARAYQRAEETENAAFESGRQAGFVAAMQMLVALDPDAGASDDHVPGRVY